MVSCLTTLWVAAALGQTPKATASAEAAWLKAVPADAEVVIRARGITTVRDDLVKMIEGMSPNAGQLARPALEGGLDQQLANLPKDAVDASAPVVILMRLPRPGADGGPPPFAALVRTRDYKALQKAISGGGGGAAKSLGGGIDQLTAQGGQSVYTFKGQDFAVVGSDQDLLKSVAQPRQALDATIGQDLRDRLIGGDLGVFVNIAAIQSRYGDQIEQFQAQAKDTLNQQGGQAPAALTEAARGAIDRAAEAIKNADSLAFNIDFDPAGLNLIGDVTVKASSAAARKVSDAKKSSGELLGKLPADASSYFYANARPETFEAQQRIGMAMLMGVTGKASPELQKALDLQRAANIREMAAASDNSRGGGVRSLTVSVFDDPRKAVEAMSSSMAALKGAETGFVKDVKVDAKAQSYQGIDFNQARLTWDLDKMAKLQPNAPEGTLKAAFGEGMTTWYGTDGKVVLAVVAPDWDSAKGQLDAYQGGKATLAQNPGFTAFRSKLPKQVGSLFAVSAQGMVRQVANQLKVMMPGNAAVAAPTDLPKTPAFFGGAVTPSAKGYQFQFVLPKAVGPVIEQGVLPMLQGLQGAQQQ